MSLRVLTASVSLSVQDQGRFKGMASGVPISGVMDQRLSNWANNLLGNRETAAVIESFGQGASFEFLKPTYIAVGSLGAKLRLNNEPVKVNRVHKVVAGDVLHFVKLKQGMWSYLAVKGGFETKEAFGSKSYYNHVLNSSKLEKGSFLSYSAVHDLKADLRLEKPDFFISEITDLKCFKLPEFKYLSSTVKHQLLTAELSISTQISRMAYQVSERLDNDLNEIKTSPVLPGTVQFTSGGQLIILMRDAQVSGGYPRVLQLTEDSICALSQLQPRSKIKFSLTEEF